MATNDPDSGGGFPVNFTTLLAILTVAGGVLLGTGGRQLSSRRPVAPAGISQQGGGDQSVEARLWEDPFSPWTRMSADARKTYPTGSLSDLRSQIKKCAKTGDKPLVLPVMVAGGTYAEDRESRVRSRYAVVAALGRAGFVPEDEEHLGVLRIPWPRSGGLQDLVEDMETYTRFPVFAKEADDARERVVEAKDLITKATFGYGTDLSAAELAAKNLDEAFKSHLQAVEKHKIAVERAKTGSEDRAWISYEWYRTKTFFPRKGDSDPERRVLLMWINELDFGQMPLMKLDLLLRPLLGDCHKDCPKGCPEDGPENCPMVKAALIGPRTSDTLRDMVGGDFAPKSSVTPDPSVKDVIRKTLGRVSLFLATPNAMDEVLVPADPTVTGSSEKHEEPGDAKWPRGPVVKVLKSKGFHGVRNFAATDSQLAGEILDELGLRNADPAKATEATEATKETKTLEFKRHVVLISERDSFYGRMMELTYAAELAVRQEKARQEKLPEESRREISSRAGFVEKYRNGEEVWPKNLHSFVFMRGLDGQASAANTAAVGTKSEPARDGQPKPATLDDLKQWTPDATKAEGAAQFDYLSRLGNRIKALDAKLFRTGEGNVAAIGIVGGDTYDTLLILEALRPKFPNALFFTTELDARFWGAAEGDWSRNLIVASGYGLELHPDLQKQVPPFRSSVQTAQFAAVLAAVKLPGMPDVATVPPRRFEIGRTGAVDLSVEDGGKFHPDAPWLSKTPFPLSPTAPWLIGVAVIAMVGLASLVLRPWRRMTFDAKVFGAEALWLHGDDIGGLPGFRIISSQLDPAAKDPEIGELAAGWRNYLEKLAPSESEVRDRNDEYFSKTDLKDLPALVARLTQPVDAFSNFLSSRLCGHGHQQLKGLDGTKSDSRAFSHVVISALNGLIASGRAITDTVCWEKSKRFAGIELRPETRYWWKQGLSEKEQARFHRLLIEDACPGEIQRRAENSERMQDFLDFLNEELNGNKGKERNQSELPPKGREKIGRVLGKLLAKPDPAGSNVPFTVAAAAAAAREVGMAQFRERKERIRGFWIGVPLMLLFGWGVGYVIWRDSAGIAEGEPFNLISGTSAWPGIGLRLLAMVLSIHFIARSYSILRRAMQELTRRYRMPWRGRMRRSLYKRVRVWFRRLRRQPASSVHKAYEFVRKRVILPTSPTPLSYLNAEREWKNYQKMARWTSRCWRIVPVFVAYFIFAFAIMKLCPEPVPPVRGDSARFWQFWLLMGAVVSFLFLTFGVMDATRLCRWQIERLSEAPTRYPEATRDHFQRLRGGLQNPGILNEWLDLQLIAELTDRVGRLIYYPFIVYAVLLLARNPWWDRWTWSAPLLVIFVLNLAWVVGSSMILQRSARKAREIGLASLQEKLNRLHGTAAKTAKEKEQHDITQAEKLIDEIRNLRTGAFGTFWQNPILGALLVPSGGTAAIHIFSYLMGR